MSQSLPGLQAENKAQLHSNRVIASIRYTEPINSAHGSEKLTQINEESQAGIIEDKEGQYYHVM